MRASPCRGHTATAPTSLQNPLAQLIYRAYEHVPTNAPVDSISPRVVCDGDFMIRQDWRYHGDSAIDQLDSLDSPDYARWGLEFDAYWFMTIGRTY